MLNLPGGQDMGLCSSCHYVDFTVSGNVQNCYSLSKIFIYLSERAIEGRREEGKEGERGRETHREKESVPFC